MEKLVACNIRKAKRNLEKKLAYSREGNNTRTFANYIKSKTKSRVSIGLLKEGGRVITDDKNMAETLNRFFSSVFNEENLQNVPAPWSETDVKLTDFSFSAKEIEAKIKNLKDRSAPGPDGIHPRVLKMSSKELAVPLQLIFMRSLDTGQIPGDWRHATVTPIFKKGAKGDPGNYRPVSLTSIPCRIFESLLNDKLGAHLAENHLIRSTQHGFIKGRSCSTNLIVFLDKLTEIVDRGKAADVFYLEFSKAFDTVPKERLLLKLQAKGIDGKVLLWIRNWLSGRTQAVKVGESVSGSSQVKSGVPQGSVLGPTLFYIFIDDIEECAELITMMNKFADDTKGLNEISCEQDKENLQLTLNNLVEWGNKWGMSFNTAKCKIMHVGNKNPGHTYYMGGEQLAFVEEERDIGVLVHKSLKPAKQCEKVARIANAVLGQLTRNFHFRDRNVFKNLYIQYVRPHLEFASPAWSPWNEQDKETVEKVQKRAVKMMSGIDPTLTYEEKCKAIGLETLEVRRNRQDVMQAFKILREIDKLDPSKFYKKQGGRSRTTRATASTENLVIPFARLEARKISFFVRTPKMWNELEDRAKNATSLKCFKNAIKSNSSQDMVEGRLHHQREVEN